MFVEYEIQDENDTFYCELILIKVKIKFVVNSLYIPFF